MILHGSLSQEIRVPTFSARLCVRLKRPTLWSFFFAIAAGACSPGISDHPTSQDVRSITVAKEILSGLAQVYADEEWQGEVRAYAVDERFLGEIGDQQLESGLRDVARGLSPKDDDAWVLSFMRLQQSPHDTEVYYLSAAVVDPYVEFCCHLIDVKLTRNTKGWHVVDFLSGGSVDETEISRKERLLRRSEVLR